MNKIFIELYLDEDVDVRIARLIRRDGFAATTARDEGQLGKSDPEQLEYAISQGWAIITHNRPHFQALANQYFIEGKTHYGIIIAMRRTPGEIAERLKPIISQMTADEMMNQVQYI